MKTVPNNSYDCVEVINSKKTSQQVMHGDKFAVCNETWTGKRINLSNISSVPALVKLLTIGNIDNLNLKKNNSSCLSFVD